MLHKEKKLVQDENKRKSLHLVIFKAIEPKNYNVHNFFSLVMI